MRSEIRSSKIIFDEFFTIEKIRVCWERFDGQMGREATRYVIRRGDSVGLVAVCQHSKRIILVRQFRLPALRKGEDGYLWEIPAGMVGRGEYPALTAERELFEETGLRPLKIRPLISFFLSPGALDERIHIFLTLVPECSRKLVTGNEEEGENLLLETFTRGNVFDMIRRGEIIDGKSIGALLYFFNLADPEVIS